MVEIIKNCIYCNKLIIDTTLNHIKLYCSISCKRSFLWRKNLNKNREDSRLNNIEHKKINPQCYKNIDIKRKESKEVKSRYLFNLDKLKNSHLYPEECCICGKTEKIEFHHPDYSFPYSVYPLCKTHHLEIHENIKKIVLAVQQFIIYKKCGN